MAVQATQDAGIVRYRASDGQDVELSPAGVVAYIVSGKAQPGVFRAEAVDTKTRLLRNGVTVG